MKPRHVLLAAVTLAVLCCFAQSAIAQSRAFAAKQFILDNGLGNTVTIQTPVGAFGDYIWTLPSTAPTVTPSGSAIGQTLYWDGSNWIPSSTIFNDGTSVGIGTTTPFTGFHRESTLSGALGTAGSLFRTYVAPTAGTLGNDFGLASESRFTGSTSITQGLTGVIGFAMLEPTASVTLSKAIGAAGAADLFSNTQLLTSGIGLHGEVANQSASTISTAVGLESWIFNTSGGTITTAEGLYLPAPYNFSGTIGKYYGIYQDNLPSANQWPYWYSDGGTGALFEITGTGRVGIGLGSTSPAYPLDLKSTSAITFGYGISSNFDVVAQPSASSTARYVAVSALAESDNSSAVTGSGYVEGIRSESQLNSTATADIILSIGTAGLSSNYSNTQTVTTGAGLHGEVRNFGTGTIGTAAALEAMIFNVSTGTINDAKTLHVQNPYNPSGTISNVYGLYVDDLTSGTKNYPIYASDGASNARFSVRNDGKVGIGTDNPVATLDLRGSLRVGTNVNAGAVADIYNYSGTLDFPSTPAQSSSDITVTATGSDIVEGDAVIVRPMNAVIMPNSSYTAWVSGPAQIKLRFNNYSSGAQDPPSGTFKFTLIQH